MATRSINKVLLMGNLTRDPELRYTASGTPVATFVVATNRTYVDSTSNKVETAEFTNVVAWAKLAEICSKILRKGSKVFIEGRLQTSKWTDKNTGQEAKRVEIVAEDMHLVSNPGGGTAPVNGSAEPDFNEFEMEIGSQDVDFSALTDNSSTEANNNPQDDNSGNKSPANDQSTPF